jgi:hypothetical protein
VKTEFPSPFQFFAGKRGNLEIASAATLMPLRSGIAWHQAMFDAIRTGASKPQFSWENPSAAWIYQGVSSRLYFISL